MISEYNEQIKKFLNKGKKIKTLPYVTDERIAERQFQNFMKSFDRQIHELGAWEEI
jgi:hypothetical protein